MLARSRIELKGPHFLLRLGLPNVRLELPGYGSDGIEEGELEIVEGLRFAGETGDNHVDHSVEHRLHRVWLLLRWCQWR